MPAKPKADPVPDTGADRAPDPEMKLFEMFEAQNTAKEAPVEKEPEEPAVEQPVTEKKPAGDADAEKVAGEEAAPEEETEPEPVLYSVTIDGEKQDVPLDELIAGYSRTGDYTRKTQTLADERRKLDAEARETRMARERYIEVTKAAEAVLTQGRDEPDWEKLAEELDPADYNRQRAQWDTRQRQVNALRTKREVEEQKAFADREAEHREYLRTEQAKLLAAVPDWKDESKARAEQAELTEYALRIGQDYGITDRVLAGIDSAFPILMLRKAMLYDRMMAAKPKVQQQTKPVPTAKPGAKVETPKVNPAMAARARLRESHDPKDAEEVFLHMATAGAFDAPR